MNKTLIGALLSLFLAIPARAFHLGLGNAVASQGAKVTDKAANLLPSCGGNFTLFTQSPVTDPSLVSITPLGHLFPPGHTLPSDHLYFNFNESTTAALGVALYAPADGWVVQVTRNDYATPAPAHSDYGVGFSPCQEVVLNFGHVDTIIPALASPSGLTTTQCNSFSEGGGPNDEAGTSCTVNMQVPVKAGQLLGTGTVGDFGPLEDTRAQIAGFVDPSIHNLNRGFCPLNYFAANVKTAYTALLGTNNGAAFIPRATAPVCGTTMQDVPGTAQGDWFFPGSSNDNGLNNLALIHDNIYPSTAVFSVGQAMPSVFQGTNYIYPKTTADGTRINYDFNLVNDAQIYCYDTFEAFPVSAPNSLIPGLAGHIALIQLSPSRTTLTIEAQNPGRNCAAAQPWSFASAAVTFQR